MFHSGDMQRTGLKGAAIPSHGDQLGRTEAVPISAHEQQGVTLGQASVSFAEPPL